MNIGLNAICCLTVIPVRDQHDDTSEIVTQLLFGELVSIVDIHNQWVKIKIYHDNYEGWVDNKQLLKITDHELHLFQDKNRHQQEALLELNTPWGIQNILQGSPILTNEVSFTVNNLEFSWKDNLPMKSNQTVSELALSYLNAPYLWGGRTHFGIDCSGFTQSVFHQLGHYLPRDASQQYLEGIEVGFEQQKVGDLAFFKSKRTGNIHHVGIILPNQQIIHAHGRVRIDTLTNEGIYNEDEKYYSHQLDRINSFAD
ncbi:C40 family peptidase [Brumimicrobium mesophilum]|uniref:C40 family peptidase n=1 Tax=Brumimicrobium mesophilum TaxID=392717 RepID=UPI000D140EC8|nr:C40 family peptidase [Brumimicrobium mesophilum]